MAAKYILKRRHYVGLYVNIFRQRAFNPKYGSWLVVERFGTLEEAREECEKHRLEGLNDKWTVFYKGKNVTTE